jgi:hypothetical protein
MTWSWLIANGTFVVAGRIGVESLGEQLQKPVARRSSEDDLTRKIL